VLPSEVQIQSVLCLVFPLGETPAACQVGGFYKSARASIRNGIWGMADTVRGANRSEGKRRGEGS
jgi:hypothetical protein